VWQPPAASLGGPVPSVHRQQVPGGLALPPFSLAEGCKLTVVLAPAGFHFKAHHPTDVLRPDQVFADRRPPTMPPPVSASGHSEFSRFHKTRCLPTVEVLADRKNEPPEGGPSTCVVSGKLKTAFCWI